ncbi:unnamed protein product [marine sediment metagenome]|uniref:Uncharacterized protein n=1 Tax=marine sediment metagenome TaxID=412755 RepID=X0W1L6_9ZZZZ
MSGKKPKGLTVDQAAAQMAEQAANLTEEQALKSAQAAQCVLSGARHGLAHLGAPQTRTDQGLFILGVAVSQLVMARVPPREILGYVEAQLLSHVQQMEAARKAALVIAGGPEQ